MWSSAARRASGRSPRPRGGRRLAGRGDRAVLDARLGQPRVGPEGYATGAVARAVEADLPDHAYWEQWFPADWVTEMREQIRLWFYSQFFMSVVLTGDSPYRRVLTYEKLQDADGPRDARLVGQPHLGRGGVRADGRGRHALAVLPAAADPEHPLRLQAGRRDQAPPADAVELGALLHRLRLDRGLRARGTRIVVDGVVGHRAAAAGRVAAGARAAARARGRGGVRARTSRSTSRASSRRSSRTSRTGTSAARGGASTRSTRRRSARCGRRSSQLVRVLAPIMPFLAEHLWQTLVAAPCGDDAPESVLLAGWPCRAASEFVDDELLAEIAATRRVAQLGRRARTRGEASSCASRCARCTSAARRCARRTPARSPRSCACKEVDFDEGPVARARDPAEPRACWDRGSAEAAGGARRAEGAATIERSRTARVLVAGEELGPDDVIRGETGRARGLGDRRGRRHQRRVRHRARRRAAHARAASTTSSTSSTSCARSRASSSPTASP